MKLSDKAWFERTKNVLNTAATPTAALMQEVVAVLQYHEWRYYVKNEPVIADEEYDMLFNKLKALELAHPEWILASTPTRRVGSDMQTDFEAVEHLTPMLSLENAYNLEDLQDFDGRVRKVLGLDTPVQYCVEPKYDGGTIVLVYENNQLVRAATRGNGVAGDEITGNARAIKSIPLQADFAKLGLQRVELRGEVVLAKTNFDKLNEKRQKEGQQLFANTRNTATGGLRMKSPAQVAERQLEAFVYQMSYAEDKDGNDVLADFEGHDYLVETLGDLGFKVPENKIERLATESVEDLYAFCTKWEAQREAYNYEIDGMVLKVDNLQYQEQCGYTSHHPRWAIAFKFKAKKATTTLLDVEYQVGRTGAITPVAKLDPVDLAGAKISNVSLHNADFIADKDIRIGDKVLVERAGDVIPYIAASIPAVRDGSEQKIVFPTTCPVCNSTLEKPETEAVWRCTNHMGCQAQVLGRMIHFVSKDAMNIDGFGEAYVERFYQEEIVKGLADIYRLDYERIAFLEGFGDKSATKLQAAVEKSKGNPAYRLLYALGIRHVGKTNAKVLVAEVERLQDLANWSVEQLMEIKDIGPKVAQTLFDTFAKPELIALLDAFEAMGVNVSRLESEEKKVIAEDAPFVGKTLVFTGSLQQMKRSEAKKMAEAAGAKVVGSVSAKLGYLVVGEKAGSKLKKAEDLGVAVLTEQQFLDKIKGE